MLFYIVQHAKSSSKEIDPERGITDEGKKETERSGKFLAGLSPDIKDIWSSDKKRAIETSYIFSEQLGLNEMVKEREGLHPNDPVLPLKKELENSDCNIMVVGHLPYLSNLLSIVINDKIDTSVLRFRNSGITCLEYKDRKWTILWSVTPEILK